MDLTHFHASMTHNFLSGYYFFFNPLSLSMPGFTLEVLCDEVAHYDRGKKSLPKAFLYI